VFYYNFRYLAQKRATVRFGGYLRHLALRSSSITECTAWNSHHPNLARWSVSSSQRHSLCLTNISSLAIGYLWNIAIVGLRCVLHILVEGRLGVPTCYPQHVVSAFLFYRPSAKSTACFPLRRLCRIYLVFIEQTYQRNCKGRPCQS
jgi:hypothetical protein